MTGKRFPVLRFLTVLPLLAIAALTFWLKNHVIDTYYLHEEIYSDAELRYTPQRTVNPSLYFIRKDKDNFLFAASTPKELEPKILFTSSANLTLTVKPDYNESDCNSGGINRTILTLSGTSFYEKINLKSNTEKNFFLSINKGQTLNIKINNIINNDCGRALISFKKANNSHFAIISFALIWLLVFLFCLSTGAISVFRSVF